MKQETEVEDGLEGFKRRVSQWEKEGVFDEIAAKFDAMIDAEVEETKFREKKLAEEIEGLTE